MPKDKQAKRISMKEVMQKDATKESPTNSVANESLDDSYLFNEEQNEKLKEYNKNITDFSDKYLEVSPRFDVLVRCFVRPMEVGENGVLKPNVADVEIATRSDVGSLYKMPNPFPYTNKAVVVATPDEVTDIKKGDIVILSNTPAKGTPIGKGDEAIITIPNAFIHPDEAHKFDVMNPVPVDPTDENYGYLLVKPYDIKFKVNN